MEAIIAAVAALILGVGSALTTVVWISKKLVGAMVAQNRGLIEGALENMKANTEAIKSNTEVTERLAITLDQTIAIRDERDKSVFRQLDRIERRIERGP